MSKKKKVLWSSALSLLLCFSMLLGTTFAWFTDSVTNTDNVIKAGNLDIELEYAKVVDGAIEDWKTVKDDVKLFDQNALWEPGRVEVVYLKVSNLGTLALKYQLGVNIVSETPGITVDEDGNDKEFKLSDHLVFKVVEMPDALTTYTDREAVEAAAGTEKGLKDYNGDTKALDAKDGTNDEDYVALIVYMPTTVGNEANYKTGTTPPEINLGVKLVATQKDVEMDSFGSDYDAGAEYPEIRFAGGSATAEVKAENGKVAETVILTGGQVSGTVPAGALLADGATALTLNVTLMEQSGSGVVAGEDESMVSVDVHVDGLAAGNTEPVIVTMQGAVTKGLNEGNLTLYHVEQSGTNQMTQKFTAAEVTDHNDFYYDPATGDITVAMATFSEIALLNEEAKWEGSFDYSWYDASKTELTIANADQLAAFGAIVGGMKKVAARNEDGTYTYSDEVLQDSFSGKTVKLIGDINIGDTSSENGYVFYPIGYYNSEGTYEKTNTAISSGFYTFEGTFDGNGHTVSNFYQNTWEMKGDHNWYDATLQYYRDGMGLFGKVYGGTVKNLTVENFSSDGEITTTGVIAAYADGATFENIAIFNCNPRVYNIGNGGIVGCVGWYAKEAELKTTFKNITVDNSNKISALWGSWDVACGGIVGQYYPTSGQSSTDYPANAGIEFVNCHVAAQMDVYNDVCANYQYYAYRYTGMLIGSVRENETIDGHVYPKMDGITATDCTVHFGDWNDYYYCELVANSLAAYTHDHQFSRLTQVASVEGNTITYLDSTTGTVPESGRYNYVVVSGEHATENATCYHFVDGAVWNHTDAGTETVDGVEGVLKEDKQHIYLEFNNLVTGYGWGVTSRGLENLDGVTNLDVQHSDNEDSVKKFEAAVADGGSYMRGTTVNIGDLFKSVENNVGIDIDNVQVFVSPVDSTSNAGGTYTANATDWTKGTLTFYGTGAASITITDYFYCTEATINIEVTEPGFLYRVGNQNSVSTAELAYLLTSSYDYSTINVTAPYDHSVTASVSDSTVTFAKTGVVGVKVDGKQYYVEVVDAANVTSKTDATSKSIVLLNDISGGFTVSNGYAVYGNGFKVICSGDGSYRSAAVSYGFVTVENGGILDNVQIICDIFPESYLYTSEMNAGADGRYSYGYSAVVVSGNSTISNCYIYGARNNIQVSEGNVTIENTVLECGSLSNIHIKSNSGYTVTLDNLTTIQYQTTSNYDSSKRVMGFGVLVGTNESESNPTIKLTGDLKQYNWVSAAHADENTGVSNAYARQAISAAVQETTYQHTINGTTMVNMGIAFLNSLDTNIADNDSRTNKAEIPYGLKDISIMNNNGKVYSIENTSGITEESHYDAEVDGVLPYVSNTNRQIMPTFVFGGTANDALSLDMAYNTTEGRWIVTFTVDLDNITDGSYDFKFSDIKVQKYGLDLSFVVEDSDGNAVSRDTTITLNQLLNSKYTLAVTDNAIYGPDGTLSDETQDTSYPFVLYATKTSIDPPAFTGLGTGTAIRTYEESFDLSAIGNVENWRPAYEALENVTVSYWSSTEGKTKNVQLSTLNTSGTLSGNVWTYSCDDYTITITGGAVHSDGTTLSPIVVGDELYFWSADKAFGTGTTSRTINLTYVFTDNNASTTETIAITVNHDDLTAYVKSDFANGSLTEYSEDSGSSGNGGTCIAEGSMITLADGSKKAVEDLRKGDVVMAFDHITGEIVHKDVVLVGKTYADRYYKNVFVFDDGTELPAINAHGIYDLDLNMYVNIDHRNYSEYVGHRFVSVDTQGNIGVKRLVDVVTTIESGYKYDVVTNENLNYVVADTLSVSHEIVLIMNSYEFGDDMRYDAEDMQSDIEKYGLYTYEDFAEYCDLAIFEKYNMTIMKVGVGKGLYTYDHLVYLLTEIALNDDVQITD